MLLATWMGCLIDQALYEERYAALADEDGDGFVAEDDCDDGDSAVSPEGTETCDGVDQDCDGDIDEGAADASAWYPDRDGDGHGARDGERLDACDAPDDYAADSLDCDDTNPDVGPDVAEVPYDGIDQDCDAGDLADVDGDGFDGGDAGPDCDDADPLIHPDAAETWANGLTDDDCDGALETIEETFGTATWYGRSAGGQAGAHVAALGDLDGDGSGEWLASAYYDTGPGSYAGVVYVVGGGSEGALAGEVVISGQAGWFTGTGLDSGDVDGDGVPDAIVGATGYGDGEGGVFLLSGDRLSADASLPDDADAVYTGTTPGTYAGAQAELVGDLDGDGAQELVIACPLLTVGEYAEGGRVYVVHPEDGEHSLADAALTWDGDVVGGGLGNVVAGAGDQNGDGYDDLVLSMNLDVAAWLIPGGGAGGVASEAAIAGIYNADDVPLSAVSVLGDVDGDGALDVGLADDTLRVHTDLTGVPWRDLDDAYATATTPAGGRIYGLTDAGDNDADGKADLFVGVPGDPTLGNGWLGLIPGSDWSYRGVISLSELGLTAISTRPNTGAGATLAVVGDVDGDGQSDLAVGAPGDDEGAVDAGGIALLPVPR